MKTIFHFARPVKHNRDFAAGLSAEHTPDFADDLVDAIGTPMPVRKWATDEEYARHIEATTYSLEEWVDIQEAIHDATLPPSAFFEEQECSEVGITAAMMERLAEESRQMDLVCGQYFG